MAMILGMSTAAFTLLHVVVLAGFIALGVVAARRFHPGVPAPASG
jgi:hypothetical protein